MRKGWIKVHVAVDVKTKEVVSIEITDESVGDGKMLSSLVEKAEKNKGIRPNKAIADGSYDSRKNFNYLNSNGIEPVIKTRKDASTRARGSPSRAKMVRERKESGYEGWRDKYKYGKRWMDETTFSRAKREYGEYVSAVRWENMVKEIKFQYAMLNVMLNGINVYSIV